MALPTSKEPQNFHFFTDPGHGWLAVKRDLLLGLGSTAMSISDSSFQRGGMVYLEEDSDAQAFLLDLKESGIEHHIIAINNDRPSEIRCYQGFALTDAEKMELKPSVCTECF